MKYRKETKQGIEIIYIQGNFTSIGVKEFREMFLSLIETPECNKVILNMENVKFIDSAGIGLLVFGHQTLKEKQGDFALCSVGDYISSTLKSINIYTVLNIYTTEQEALEKLAES